MGIRRENYIMTEQSITKGDVSTSTESGNKKASAIRVRFINVMDAIMQIQAWFVTLKTGGAWFQCRNGNPGRIAVLGVYASY